MRMLIGCVGGSHQESPLKHQSRYSGETWKPGEIPVGTMIINRPHGAKHNGVQRPTSRGTIPTKGE